MRQFDNLLSGGVGKRSAGDEHAPELVDPGVACRVDIFEHLIKIQHIHVLHVLSIADWQPFVLCSSKSGGGIGITAPGTDEGQQVFMAPRVLNSTVPALNHMSYVTSSVQNMYYVLIMERGVHIIWIFQHT